MKEIFKRLDELLAREPFFKVYMQSPYRTSYHCMDGTEMECGATRSVIIFPDCDYVVKFDIDEDRACTREVERYKCAQAYHVENMLAGALYIGNYTATYEWWDVMDYPMVDDDDELLDCYNQELEGYEKRWITISIPLYMYPKACCSPIRYRDLTNEDYKRVGKSKNPLSERTKDIAAAFIHDWGVEMYEQLVFFCALYHINDIHSDNIGYISGKIVLIDYAGYYTEDDSSTGGI